MTQLPPAGWYPEPNDTARLRWWDGTQWTDYSSTPLVSAATGSADKKVPISPRAVARSSAWRPSTSTWIVGAIAVAVALIGAITGGFGGFLVIVSLFVASAGIWTLATSRPGWLNLRGKRRVGTILLAASAAAFLVGAIALPHGPSSTATNDAKPVAAAVTPAPSTTPTPTPRPTHTPTSTPVLTPVAGYIGVAGADAESALTANGFLIEKRASDGSAQSDWTGWSVVDQQPAAGTALAAGSKVILILDPPAPPVAEAPVPEQVAPEPAPADPEPAPAEPAPAPASDAITPGAFCPDASVGSTATAANGKTYTCGGKGADANGHYHWNAP